MYIVRIVQKSVQITWQKKGVSDRICRSLPIQRKNNFLVRVKVLFGRENFFGFVCPPFSVPFSSFLLLGWSVSPPSPLFSCNLIIRTARVPKIHQTWNAVAVSKAFLW